MKTCSFLHADFTESMKLIENLFKKGYCETLFIAMTYAVGTYWSCLNKVILMCSYNKHY